jgi:hypothetical protein
LLPADFRPLPAFERPTASQSQLKQGGERGCGRELLCSFCEIGMQRRTISPMPGPFSNDEILVFLAEGGYIGNPKGLAQPFPVDYVQETDALAYLDINADAVRKGDEVPDRPVRITLQKTFDGTFTRWKLKSVEELTPGIRSKCMDRHQDTPKISPWTSKP